MKKNISTSLLFAGILMATLSAAPPVLAQVEPRDLTVCDGVTCETLTDSICRAGFKITLTYYEPASGSEGAAIYKYEICDAHLTDCPVIVFNELSHFDVTFPEPGNSCLTQDTDVIGYCECKVGSSAGCSVDEYIVLGDEDCFTESSPVAKCDNIDLQPGDCIVMTLIIIGENPDLGLGPAVVVDKADDYCTANCIVGPACNPCEEPPPTPNAGACLTRTHGFWGTHPHLIQGDDPRSLNLLPITVCGEELTETAANACGTSEALCSNANDYKANPPYLSFITQLTAAKLNLKATAAILDGLCADWSYGGKSIHQWIISCEGKCSANKHDIGRSGCIEALTAFNESQETGFDVLPPPFDRPGPANPSKCQDARGNGKYIGLNGWLGCVTVSNP